MKVGNIIIQDRNTYTELTHFVMSDTSYAAEQGFHDDLVMGFVNFANYCTSRDFQLKYDQSFIEEYTKEYGTEIYDENFAPLAVFSDAQLRQESFDMQNKWLNEF